MFAPTVAQVNAALMLHAHSPLRLAEVSRASHTVQRVTESALDTLEKRGLIVRTRPLGYDLFAPNGASPYYRSAYLAALVDLPIDAALADSTIVAVLVFGSMARGGAGHDSDIDLLVVGRVPDDKAARRRLNEIGARYGRGIDSTFITVRDLRTAIENHDQFMSQAVSTGILIRGRWE